jgi:glutaconyl-CoA decarboxylase
MQSFRVTVNGKIFEVTVEETGAAQAHVERVASEASAVSEVAPPPAPAQPAIGSAEIAIEAGDQTVTAPLAGTILSIKVQPGQAVRYGQVLLTLEALKMENEIVAPQAGTVKAIRVNEGSSVNVGDAMIILRS